MAQTTWIQVSSDTNESDIPNRQIGVGIIMMIPRDSLVWRSYCRFGDRIIEYYSGDSSSSLVVMVVSK